MSTATTAAGAGPRILADDAWNRYAELVRQGADKDARAGALAEAIAAENTARPWGT